MIADRIISAWLTYCFPEMWLSSRSVKCDFDWYFIDLNMTCIHSGLLLSEVDSVHKIMFASGQINIRFTFWEVITHENSAWRGQNQLLHPLSQLGKGRNPESIFERCFCVVFNFNSILDVDAEGGQQFRSLLPVWNPTAVCLILFSCSSA